MKKVFVPISLILILKIPENKIPDNAWVWWLQDHKLKHMADLQQSVVSDPDTKQQINSQIVQWEENLERLHCEQFRLRCYMASLQNGELPNPKV